MQKKNDNKKDKKKKSSTDEDILKYEIANELGLSEKLAEVGWGGLSAQETGRIGGIITQKKKAKLALENKEGKK